MDSADSADASASCHSLGRGLGTTGSRSLARFPSRAVVLPCPGTDCAGPYPGFFEDHGA